MSELSERVEARLRAEWPGTMVTTRNGYAPRIRPDGATDTLIKMAARIVEEEASR